MLTSCRSWKLFWTVSDFVTYSVQPKSSPPKYVTRAFVVAITMTWLLTLTWGIIFPRERAQNENVRSIQISQMVTFLNLCDSSWTDQNRSCSLPNHVHRRSSLPTRRTRQKVRRTPYWKKKGKRSPLRNNGQIQYRVCVFEPLELSKVRIFHLCGYNNYCSRSHRRCLIWSEVSFFGGLKHANLRLVASTLRPVIRMFSLNIFAVYGRTLLGPSYAGYWKQSQSAI